MEVKAISLSITDIMAASRDSQGNGAQVQREGSPFGPCCRLTISKEGKDLSMQQEEKNTVATQAQKKLLRRLEKAGQKQADKEKARKDKEMELAENSKYAAVMDEAEKLLASSREAAEKTEEPMALKSFLQDMYRDKYSGEELQEVVEQRYKDITGVPSEEQFKAFPVIELTDEEAAALEEMASQLQGKLEDILKNVTLSGAQAVYRLEVTEDNRIVVRKEELPEEAPDGVPEEESMQ